MTAFDLYNVFGRRKELPDYTSWEKEYTDRKEEDIALDGIHKKVKPYYKADKPTDSDKRSSGELRNHESKVVKTLQHRREKITKLRAAHVTAGIDAKKHLEETDKDVSTAEIVSGYSNWNEVRERVRSESRRTHVHSRSTDSLDVNNGNHSAARFSETTKGEANKTTIIPATYVHRNDSMNETERQTEGGSILHQAKPITIGLTTPMIRNIGVEDKQQIQDIHNPIWKNRELKSEIPSVSTGKANVEHMDVDLRTLWPVGAVGLVLVVVIIGLVCYIFRMKQKHRSPISEQMYSDYKLYLGMRRRAPLPSPRDVTDSIDDGQSCIYNFIDPDKCSNKEKCPCSDGISDKHAAIDTHMDGDYVEMTEPDKYDYVIAVPTVSHVIEVDAVFAD